MLEGNRQYHFNSGRNEPAHGRCSPIESARQRRPPPNRPPKPPPNPPPNRSPPPNAPPPPPNRLPKSPPPNPPPPNAPPPNPENACERAAPASRACPSLLPHDDAAGELAQPP